MNAREGKYTYFYNIKLPRVKKSLEFIAQRAVNTLTDLAIERGAYHGRAIVGDEMNEVVGLLLLQLLLLLPLS